MTRHGARPKLERHGVNCNAGRYRMGRGHAQAHGHSTSFGRNALQEWLAPSGPTILPPAETVLTLGLDRTP